MINLYTLFVAPFLSNLALFIVPREDMTPCPFLIGALSIIFLTGGFCGGRPDASTGRVRDRLQGSGDAVALFAKASTGGPAHFRHQ